MDLIEKLNNKFGGWYESLFGENGNLELRPKDVLRKILHAMDDNRSEGIDGKVYVPNKYILVLNLADSDERDYLLSFLDEEELAAVLNRYMAQNHYATRGPLDFTITDDNSGNSAAPKLVVKVKYEKGQIERPDPEVVASREASHADDEDLPTVASLNFDDLPTVAAIPSAWGSLSVTEPDGHRSLLTLTGNTFFIGRSRNVGNDLTLPADGKVSKKHAKIVRNTDGAISVADLGSTNGVTVNGRRIADTTLLRPGDNIGIGDSIIVFQQDAQPAQTAAQHFETRKKAVLSPSLGGADYILASDNLIGKSITCDIVLNDLTSANRQAQIVAHESGSYTIEDLSGRSSTMVNDRVVRPGERIRLTNGDRVQFGPVVFHFLEKLA